MNIVGHKQKIAQMVYDSLGCQNYLTDAFNQLIEFDYDDQAQITAFKDASTSPTIQSFDYDALYRITDYSGLGEARTFAYDPNGNRTAESLNSNNFTSTVFPNSNRLQSTTGPLAKTFSYDKAGNTTNDGINTYTYDVRNRLRSINNNSKGYLINALGQRVMKHDTLNAGDANNDGQITLADVPVTADHIVQKSTALGNPDCTNDSKVTVHDIVCINNQLTSPPTATNQIFFIYDEAGHLIGEYDKDGNVIKEYIWLQNIPVAVRQSNTNYYIYTDHLTTPREIADTTGTVIWRWESDPFGIAQPDEDPDNNAQAFTFNFRFPGQYYDLETGLHYNYFRDYDPTIGRYITSDPIGLEGGHNTYGYVAGNPLNSIDFLGLEPGVVRPFPFPMPPVIIPGPSTSSGPPAWWTEAVEAASNSSGKAKQCGKNDNSCPPCRLVDGTTVPLGTIAYRPLDTPDNPQHGIVGSHYNIYKANQNPNNCQCFWQSQGAVGPSQLPPDAIPIQPFAN